MSNFTAHICSWCGASLEPVGNDLHKCSNCGRTYSDGNVKKRTEYQFL